MKETIISKDNKYIKLTRSLEKKKYRTKEGLFVVDGLRNCREALFSDNKISYIFVNESKCDNKDVKEIVALAEKQGVLVMPVENRLFSSVSITEESQGIIAVAEIQQINKDVFKNFVSSKKIAILDGLQDPGNLGTILRTAWAAGLGGIIAVNNTVDIYNPKVVRSAMGAVYNLPVIYMNNQEATDFLKEEKYSIFVADANGMDYRKNKPKEKIAWLLGSEGNGVSEYWRNNADYTVSIPMAPNVESLNVAVAAGILFFSLTDF